MIEGKGRNARIFIFHLFRNQFLDNETRVQKSKAVTFVAFSEDAFSAHVNIEDCHYDDLVVQ